MHEIQREHNVSVLPLSVISGYPPPTQNRTQRSCQSGPSSLIQLRRISGCADNTQTLGKLGGALKGISTANNVRFLRYPWEVQQTSVFLARRPAERSEASRPWVPYIKGAAGQTWWEPLGYVPKIKGRQRSLSIAESPGSAWRNDRAHFKLGVAFPRVGNQFSDRAHRYISMFDAEGPTILAHGAADATCMLNSKLARRQMGSLDPTIHFTQGDVSRLPAVAVEGSEEIFRNLESLFTTHESHREDSVEFRRPGPSPWHHAQDWAQAAVEPGRHATPRVFRAARPRACHRPPKLRRWSRSRPVRPSRQRRRGRPRSGHLGPFARTAARNPFPRHHAQRRRPPRRPWPPGVRAAARSLGGVGPAVGTSRRSLRDWLALDFFKDVHKGMYENRHSLATSSSAKTFVAWVNIHRMNSQTLQVLLADHLAPTLTPSRRRAGRPTRRPRRRRQEGRARRRATVRPGIQGPQRAAGVHGRCRAVRERGALPTDGKCPPREQDARYAPDLDDGVMINSAALWPLFDPQWKDPKKWWRSSPPRAGGRTTTGLA